jgi:hypothetical protein
MITADILQRRIEMFWGYGSLKSPVWFVGMEEGLGFNTSEEQLDARFFATDGKTTVDMRRDMMQVRDHIECVMNSPRIQPTWKYPIALCLYLKNQKFPLKEEIRNYQEFVLGDNKREQNAVIELMPLPSNKAHESAWIYGKYGISGLNSRKEYLAMHKSKRVKELRSLIKTYSPKLVIFHSLGYLSDWVQIVGIKFEEMVPQMYFAENGGTDFCVIPQGSSFGMSYHRLYGFAEIISERVKFLR